LRRFFFAVLLLPITASTVYALSARSVGGTLYINETPVLTLRSASGGSPSAKAAALASRLQGVSDGAAVSVSHVKRAYSVHIGPTAVTIKKAEAKAHGLSPATLAYRWAASIKSALNLPALKLGSKNVVVPVGGVASVSLVGKEAKDAILSRQGDSVSLTRKIGSIQFKGTKLGTTEFSIAGKSSLETVVVRVLPYAVEFPQTVTAHVTGVPASKEVVRGAIRTALNSSLRTVPAAWLVFDTPKATALQTNQSRTYHVVVKASAANAIPSKGVVTVNVRNEGIHATRESELWYCNFPENIKKPGLLFASPLVREKAARFLFHHMNVSSGPLIVEAQAVNPSALPASIMVIPGAAEPDRNPVLVGARAADQFLRNWLFSSGEIVTIPARSTVPITVRRLATQETTSGLFYLRLLSGGPDSIFVRADARTPETAVFQWEPFRKTAAPWQVARPKAISEAEASMPQAAEHVFPNPFKNETVAYEVGSKHGFVRIGQKPIEREDQLMKLDGNFGVVYNIKASMKNPLTSPAKVEIVFEASAGYSGGLFVVNGRILRSPLLQSKGEYKLWEGVLAPGAEQSCSILTVPLSGSSYPATITVRTTDSLASVISR